MPAEPGLFRPNPEVQAWIDADLPPAKPTATPGLRDTAGIHRVQAHFGERACPGFAVCLVERPIPLSDRVWAVPIGGV